MSFTFADTDAIYQPPQLPHELVILALRDALNAVQVRIAFIGHPHEPGMGKPWPQVSHPDWSKEIDLIEQALKLVRCV